MKIREIKKDENEKVGVVTISLKKRIIDRLDEMALSENKSRSRIYQEIIDKFLEK